MKDKFRAIALIAGALTFGASHAWADDDSSAIAGEGFVHQVQQSTGAILRVQINQQGEELVSSAETRVVNSAPTSTASLPAAFAAAPSTSDQPVVTGDSSTSADSSTWGWYYGSYYGSYYYPSYYYSYYPSYYYYGSYYPYYYSSYYSYYPYRYYYYGRYW